ncbi:MAG: hypothetical protein V2B18_07730, partial [Pseudomonadota bacterium]
AAEETDKVVPAKSLEKVYERVLDVISMYEAIMKLESPDARQREILYRHLCDIRYEVAHNLNKVKPPEESTTAVRSYH